MITAQGSAQRAHQATISPTSPTDSGDDRLSTRQAARLLGVSARYMRRLITDGRIATIDGPTSHLTVRRADVVAFAATRVPPVARVGYDVTLTCEKSIAIGMLLSTGPTRQVFIDAFDRANRAAIDYLDRHAAVARRQGSQVATGGFTIASYLHATSRMLDPHPHRHNVIANTVATDTGDRRAVDARALYQHAPAAAAIATATMRWELRHLNVGWWQRDDGIWEIVGINRTVIDEFSRRRSDMNEITTVLEQRLGRRVTLGELDTIALATRTPKTPTDPTELQTDWHQRARQHGLNPDHLDVILDHPGRTITHAHLPTILRTELDRDLASPAGLTATTSVFTRGDVIPAITNWAVTNLGVTRKVVLPPDEIEHLADGFLNAHHVLALNAAHGPTNAPLYTTTELYRTQTAIITAYRSGLNAGCGVVPGDVQHDVLAGHPNLTTEQHALVAVWCSSGNRIQTAIGRAGTGKTTTMRAAVECWTAAGYRVIGAAVKGEAARQLAHDAGITADTVALLLTLHHNGRPQLDRRTVLIIDEASTLGDRDLATIIGIAEHTGATLRLIGDPAQHASVAAGGSFNAICRREPGNTPELTHVFRLEDPSERQSAEVVRSGPVADVVDHLVASGQLVIAPNQHTMYADMLTRWYQHRTNAHPHPMVHGRNRERTILNRLAQAILQTDGTVSHDGIRLTDGRSLCVGDEFIARHGDRTLHPAGQPDHWVRNGTRGTLIAVRADQHIVVRTDSGDVVCPPGFYNRRRGGLDLAYALISYAVQGSTHPASTSAMTPLTSRAELYVDITRGQTSNLVYAARAEPDSADDRHLPVIETDLGDDIQRGLRRQRERTAYEIDPTGGGHDEPLVSLTRIR